MEDILADGEEQDRVPLQKLQLLGNGEKSGVGWVRGGWRAFGQASGDARNSREFFTERCSLSQSCVSLQGLKDLNARNPAFRRVSFKVYL